MGHVVLQQKAQSGENLVVVDDVVVVAAAAVIVFVDDLHLFQRGLRELDSVMSSAMVRPHNKGCSPG